MPYALHTEFNQTTVFDDSNTDWHLTRFDITVQCVLNSSYLTLLASDLLTNGQPDTTDPAVIMKALRERLLRPRRSLAVAANGFTVTPNTQVGLPANSTVDSQNGPRPKFCRIDSLGNTTFLLTYGISAEYWENNSDPDPDGSVTRRRGSAVLYNRWEETVSVNRHQVSTRTRGGKFCIRSDNVQGLTIDQLRPQFAVLSLPPGFLRIDQEYTIDPSGLILRYRVVDEEQFKMPPPPAFEADGDYTEFFTDYGGVRYGEAWVRLDGDVGIDQTSLITTAVTVVANMLNLAGVNVENRDTLATEGLLESGSLTVGKYKNWVLCRMRAMLPTRPERIKTVAFGVTNMAFTPGSDGVEYTPPYLDRGTAQLVLQAAAYYNPSLTDPVLQASPVNPIAPEVTRTPVGFDKVQYGGVIPGQAGIDPEFRAPNGP